MFAQARGGGWEGEREGECVSMSKRERKRCVSISERDGESMGECNRLNACEEDCPTVVDGGGSSTDGDIFAAQIQLFDNSTQHVFYLTIFSSQSLTITHTHFSLSHLLSLSLLLSLYLSYSYCLSLTQTQRFVDGNVDMGNCFSFT